VKNHLNIYYLFLYEQLECKMPKQKVEAIGRTLQAKKDEV